MEINKEARETIDLVKRLYFVENRSREEIRNYLGLKEKALDKIIGLIESKGAKGISAKVREPQSTKSSSETIELEEYSAKQMSFMRALQNGELIKNDYSNNWAKISGELVKEDIKNTITLSMATNVVYPSKLKEMISLLEWQDNEINKAIESVSYDDSKSAFKIGERIDLVKKIVRMKLNAMGLKGNRDLSELIQAVGNLNVAEEKLMTEKVKNATDESNQEDVKATILKIYEDIEENKVELDSDDSTALIESLKDE